MVWENILLMKLSNDVDKIEETKIARSNLLTFSYRAYAGTTWSLDLRWAMWMWPEAVLYVYHICFVKYTSFTEGRTAEKGLLWVPMKQAFWCHYNQESIVVDLVMCSCYS